MSAIMRVRDEAPDVFATLADPQERIEMIVEPWR
jgi:hypothetical protein